MELEQLCQSLGITQFISQLSDFRDELIRAHAAEIQSITLASQAKDATISSQAAEITRLTVLIPEEQPPQEYPPVSRGQLRQALRIAGLLVGIETAIIGGTDDELKIWYQDTVMFHRDNRFLNAFAASQNMTEEQVNTIWKTAMEQQP